jgi:hypothetical protein
MAVASVLITRTALQLATAAGATLRLFADIVDCRRSDPSVETAATASPHHRAGLLLHPIRVVVHQRWECCWLGMCVRDLCVFALHGCFQQ